MNQDDRIRIAKAFTAYRDALRADDTEDLMEYNQVEESELNGLASRLELPEDYYDRQE